jgi:membrane fusion protein (multidrug efflux system)
VAQARPVEAGEWITRGAGADAEQWVIRTGLAAGDQVILDNLIKIRPGAPVQPAAATASAADTCACCTAFARRATKPSWWADVSVTF